jgi:hypothetical protein
MDYERYILIRDSPDELSQTAGEQAAANLIVILSVSGSICEGITLFKKDDRMLNFLDLVGVLNKLPITEYRFGAERRLGNKYQFIIELLGGKIYENYDGFYYNIDTVIARERFYMKVLKKARREFNKISERLQNLFCDKARTVFDEIGCFMEAQNFIPADKKEHFSNKLKEFIEEARDAISKVLEERVSAKNEACVLLLEKDDEQQALKSYIENIISDEATLYYKKLSEITVEVMAWLEFEKGKELARKQAEAKSAEHQMNSMQQLFYKPAPYEECFTQMGLLYEFLNDNKEMPKMQTASCNGCRNWREDKQFCALYKCAIAAVPFGCTHWAIEGIKKAKTRHKDAIPASETIREKCGLCAYYIEDDNFCTWINVEVTTIIAGCVRHKTIRELFPYCLSCGKHINKTDDFCGYCGAKAYQGTELKRADTMAHYCATCGAQMHSNDRFCENCGAASYYG